MPKRTYIIDGNRCGSLIEAAAVLTRVLELTTPWDGSLATLPALLRGGFGTPRDGFILVWKNAESAKAKLNHRALIHPLRDLISVDPSKAAAIEDRIDDAKSRRGPTLFEVILDIFRAQDGVEVRIE